MGLKFISFTNLTPCWRLVLSQYGSSFFCSMIGIFLSLLDENSFCLPIAVTFSSRTLNSLFLQHLGTMINRLISFMSYNPRQKRVEWRTALVHTSMLISSLRNRIIENKVLWESMGTRRLLQCMYIWKILFFQELCWSLFHISSFTMLML